MNTILGGTFTYPETRKTTTLIMLDRLFFKSRTFLRGRTSHVVISDSFLRVRPVTLYGRLDEQNNIQTFLRNRFNISHKRPLCACVYIVVVIFVGRRETERNIADASGATHVRVNGK